MLTCFINSLHIATLRLGFAEEDVNTRESDKMVEITITTQGTVSEPVTVEIVPMDIERLRELGKDLPFNQQSATSGKLNQTKPVKLTFYYCCGHVHVRCVL